MKKFVCLTAAAILTAGCSAAPTKVEINAEIAATNSVANQPVAPIVAATANNRSNVNVETSDNANKVVLRDASISGKNNRNWSDKNLGSKENTPIAENVSRAATAAPDNSEVLSSMNEKFLPLETRVFKKHPRLAKVERTDLNNSDIKVYLKNGKVLTLPESKAASFLTATAAEILEAVGVR